MSEPTTGYFLNPAFVAYLSLLPQLHACKVRGEHDSPEAWAIRDRMREPGNQLSRDESDAINGIEGVFDRVGKKAR